MFVSVVPFPTLVGMAGGVEDFWSGTRLEGRLVKVLVGGGSEALGDPGGDNVFLTSAGLPFQGEVGGGLISSANTDGFRIFPFVTEPAAEV